jgi:hypothetical protein
MQSSLVMLVNFYVEGAASYLSTEHFSHDVGLDWGWLSCRETSIGGGYYLL